MSNQRSCIFCLREGSLTREHVIPKWLEARLRPQDAGPKSSKFIGVHLSPFLSELSKRTVPSDNHTLKLVCASCNNGWMSNLEQEFSSISDRLRVDQNPRNYTKTERNCIASWIFKSAIIAHLSSNYRPILPKAIANQFYSTKSLPNGVKVFLGNADRNLRLEWAQSTVRAITLPKSIHGIFNFSKETLIFILAIEGCYIGLAWKHDKLKNFKFDLNYEKCSALYPSPNNNPNLIPIAHVIEPTFFVQLVYQA